MPVVDTIPQISRNSGPPHSLEAEQGLLGSILLSPSETIPECARKITVHHFFVPAHRTIYTALVDRWDAEEAIDLITFTQFLRDKNLLDAVGGAAYVTRLFTFVPCAANIGYYIDIVCEKYALREIIAGATESVRRAYEQQTEPAELLDELESRVASIRSLHGRNGTGLPPIDDAADLVASNIVLPDDVISGVLHRGGKMVAGGASKSNKTWLLMDTAVSVATGTDWLGKFQTKRGQVLFINLEIQRPFFAKRLRTICDERQLKIENGWLRVWNLRGYASDLSNLLPQMLSRIRPGDYDVIIIDPIYKVLGERDENKAGDIASLLNEVELLAVRSRAAVAFGAHYSKGNQAQKQSIDRIGGSGVFARDPDTIINFTRHEELDCFTVEMTLRNHPPREPFVVQWAYPLFVVQDMLDPARLKQAGRKPNQSFSADKILGLLTTSMTTAKWQKLASDELGVSRTTFYRRKEELEQASKIHMGKGRKWSQVSK
jgi:DnaB helicase-like protein/AAA domain-containing protein